MESQNLVSHNLDVTLVYAAVDVQVDYRTPIIGIQNNTGDAVFVKFNGGDGELVIPPGALHEPLRPIVGVFEIKATVAGPACILT